MAIRSEAWKVLYLFMRGHTPEEVGRVWAVLQALIFKAAADASAIRQGIKDACIGAPVTPPHNAQPIFVVGLFALVVGPFLLALNLVVFAPIIEMFVPAPGEPWFLPGVGPIQPIALILAAVITLVELICAVTVMEAPDLFLRVPAGIVLAVAVGFECWGGYLRGAIGDPTGGEAVLAAGNPALVSALLSFLAPSAEAIAGCLAFRGVLQPLAMPAFHLVRLVHHRITIWYLWKRYSRYFDAIWIDPKVQQAVAAAQTTVDEASSLIIKGDAVWAAAAQLIREASALASGVSNAAAIRDAREWAKAAESAKNLLTTRLEAARKQLPLAEPLPAMPAPAMNEAAIGQNREKCQARAKALETFVAGAAKAAYDAAEAVVEQLSSPHGAQDGEPWVRLCAEKGALREMVQALHAQKAERAKVFIACRDALAGEQFGQYFPASQEHNLTLVRHAVTDLDGTPPFEGWGSGSKDRVTRLREAVAALEDRLKADLPETSILVRVCATLKNAEAALEQAEEALAAFETIPAIQARSRFRHCRDGIAQTYAEFTHDVEDTRQALQQCIDEADALLAARRRNGTLWGRLRRWLNAPLAEPMADPNRPQEQVAEPGHPTTRSYTTPLEELPG